MRKLAFALVLTSGCVKTSSDNLLTSGIYASIEAESAGTGTTNVSTTLFVGNPINLNFVELAGADQLIASHEGQDKVMTESEILNVIGYHATFQTDAEDATFEVSFIRGVDAGAPSSLMSLPAKFELAPAPSGASRNGPLQITWAPAGTADIMAWQVDGDCIEREQETLTGDTGSFTIETGRLRMRQGDGIADTCDITIKVTRSREGDLDRNYGEGGTIFGRQVRTVTLQSTP